MLTGDSFLLCDSQQKPAREIREESIIKGAAGWGEIGDSKVGDVFVQFDHKGPIVTLTTSGGAEIRCSPDHLCFCRLNPLLRMHYIYLHERSTMGFRIGASVDLMRDLVAMQNLKLDLFNQHDEMIDRVWIVQTSENVLYASFLEKFMVFKYGLPNVPFSGKLIDSELSDEMIRELFNRIDTPSRAQQLLLDQHMFDEHPHIVVRLAKSGPPKSSAIQFILFGAAEKSAQGCSFAHLIRIDGAAELNRSEHKQFKRKMTSQGAWNLEVTRDDIEEAELFVKTLSHLDNLEIVKKIQLTKKAPFYILPASHVKIGMTVPVMGSKGIEEDTVSTIKIENYEGALYDFKIAHLHNYIANRWVIMSYKAKTLAHNAKSQ